MDDSLRLALKQYVRPNQIFGPVNSTVVKESRCAAVLFDWQNYVFAELLEGSDIVIDVDTARQVHVLETYAASHAVVPPVEIMSKMWTRRIWRLIGRELAAGSPNLASLTSATTRSGSVQAYSSRFLYSVLQICAFLSCLLGRHPRGFLAARRHFCKIPDRFHCEANIGRIF